MDLTIGARTFTTGKLDAFKQLHVARRLMPVLTQMSGGLADSLPKMAEALATMSDSDVDYIIGACLKVTRLHQPSGLAPLVNGHGQLMFQDLELDALIQIASAVIRENLGGFFQGGLLSTGDEAAA